MDNEPEQNGGRGARYEDDGKYRHESHAGLALMLLFKRILTLIILVLVVAAGYWAWTNQEWLLYHVQRQYDRKAYGLNWKVEIATAGQKARKEQKQILIAFLQDGNAASDYLKKNVFPLKSFQVVENNYVLMLVDYPKGGEGMSTREKTFCDELIKKYDVQKFGTIVVADPAENHDHRELRRITVTKESPSALLGKIAGGKFVAKAPVDSTPKLEVIPKALLKAREKVQALPNAMQEKIKNVTGEDSAATSAVSKPADIEVVKEK